MATLTLIVVPGPGARSVTFSAGTTIAQLVSDENLHGRDIIVNGSGIAPTTYANTTLIDGSEVFATSSVKGNTPSTGVSIVVISNDHNPNLINNIARLISTDHGPVNILPVEGGTTAEAHTYRLPRLKNFAKSHPKSHQAMQSLTVRQKTIIDNFLLKIYATENKAFRFRELRGEIKSVQGGSPWFGCLAAYLRFRGCTREIDVTPAEGSSITYWRVN